MMEGPGADSEEKHEPVSDIDTAVVVVGLKALDPEWPIREAIGGISRHWLACCWLDPVASVKGFGCRPHTAMPRTPAAGVRKPPREETAIGEGGAVPRGRYGDLSATAVGANGA